MNRRYCKFCVVMTTGAMIAITNGACDSSGSNSQDGQGGEGGEVWGQVGATSSNSSSSGGQAGAGGEGQPLEGQTKSCYTGPIEVVSVGACKQGVQTYMDGVWSACMGDIMPSPEICDDIDNDCNGEVDDGTPNEGMPCPPAPILCGAFVGPAGIGAPGNPGTQALPLSTIAEAQVLAAMVGGDICLCDSPEAGESVFPEDVTMIEGISIFGGYNCADWSRDIDLYFTTIHGNLSFSNGISSATVLNGLGVRGKDYNEPMQQPETSLAIGISNSSPRLVNVKATGGAADYSIGMSIAAGKNEKASPTVIGGVYSAGSNGWGVFGGQTGICVSSAAGKFTNVTVSPGGSSDNATGFLCSDCSSTIVGGTISGGYSQKYTQGVVVTGYVKGFSITNTKIDGGYANGVGAATGIDFTACGGSPILTNVTIHGGNSSGTAEGILARGPSCSPNISNSTISGGTAFTRTFGMNCYDSALCSLKGSTIDGGSSSAPLAVNCHGGGCKLISGNVIKTNTPPAIAFGMATIEVANTSPTFEDNEIIAPGCADSMNGMVSIYATRFKNSASILKNNVFRDQLCSGEVKLIGIENGGPTLLNNTIQFTTCTGCGSKYGLVLDGSTSMAIVRNNIFFNAGTDNFASAFAIAENTATSDPAIFEHNALWAPNGGTLYWNEGSSALSLAAINALSGSTGNISADPMLDSTFHLLPNSPCRNAGTATSAPVFDFDGNARPQELVFDIGADEYVP